MRKPDEPTRALEEAAAWFTKLSRPSVTTQALRAFRDWRRTPANRSAYEEVERVWRGAGALAHDRDMQAATHALAGQGAARARQRARWAWSAAALGGVVALAAGVATSGRWLGDTYATGVAEQRILRLADGSNVRLNARSRIRVRMDRGERRIDLARGEALFEVAHDPSRPFHVRAGGVDVVAVGTRFDVDRRARAVEVSLLDGVVRIERPSQGPPILLRPQQAVRLAPGVPAAPRAVAAAEAAGWTDGRLIFRATPLAEALEAVNRYANAPVRLESGRLANAPVSGVFVAGDTEAFARAAASLFDLEAVAARDGYVLRDRRPVPHG